MKIKRLIVGIEEPENCYCISENDHAILIDPGSHPKKILKYLEKEELELDYILITHGHYDHFMAVDKIVDKYHCPVYMHPLDTIFLKYDKKIEGSNTMKTKTTDFPKSLCFQTCPITVLHTPGHSEGSCCFIIQQSIFSGDIIFKDGIGRYDLYGGDKKDLENSLQEIRHYSSYMCYPGHEEPFKL